MYEVFNVSGITKDIRNKTITITTTSEVSVNSINEKTITLLEKASKEPVDYTYKVVRKEIILTLTEWPKPNVEYILKIGNLLNAVGDTLAQRIRRTVIFQSSVKSLVKIVSPTHGETIDRFTIKIQEIVPDQEEAINQYAIELSTDPNFHRVVKTLNPIAQTEVNIDFLEADQYFIRARAESEIDGELAYGLWSETTAVKVINHDCEPIDPDFGIDHGSDGVFDPDFDDIYVQELEVISSPSNGTTPESILIGFSTLIDEASIGDIVVLRRDY